MSIPYTYIIAEKDGKQVKIPYNEFADSFVTYTAEPASPNTEGGQQGMFSASAWSTITGTESTSSSAYVYSNNAWRKIPTYTTNWDDLEAVTNEDDTISYLRFLPVHKSVELTEKEIDIARKNIDVTIATNTHPGLVKGSTYSDMYGGINVAEDGALQAALASTVHAGAVILIGDMGSDPDNPTIHLPLVYSKQAIDAKFTLAGAWIIPLATPEIIGGIKIGEHLHIADLEQLTVDKAYVQEQPLYGLVRFAPSNYDPDPNSETGHTGLSDSGGPYVLSVEQTQELINYIVSQGVISAIEIPKATALALGGVKIDSSESNIAFNSFDVIYVTNATSDKAGVVKISDVITENDKENSNLNTVPTLKAVADYLTTTTVLVPTATTEVPGIVRIGPNLTILEDGLLGVKFPLASFSQNTAGIVNVTNTLTGNINSTLVPTTQAVSDYVIQKIEQTIETPTVPSANAVYPGVVLVNPVQSDTLIDNTYTVPTVEKTKELIDDGIESYANSQSVLLCKHWVVLGTGSFTQEDVDTATSNNELPTATIVSSYSRISPAEEDSEGNTITPGGIALAPGINLLKFSTEVSKETVLILLDDLADPVVGYYDNNFLIMPATAGIGSFLK